MSQMTNYMENKLADFLRGQGLTLPTNWYMALGSAASDSSFTELSGTGYARQSVARSLANFAGTQGAGTTVASSGTSHATSNNGAISWGDPGSAWGTANYVGFFDASTGGNCWIVVPISPLVITTGSPNPVQVAIAGLALALGITGGCSDYFANKLIDLIFRAQSYSIPATVYDALYTSAPSNAGGGVEVSGGSYARLAIVPGLSTISGTPPAGSTSASSGSAGRISNNADLAFPAPTADWGTVVAKGILDAASSGNLLMWAALTAPRTVLNGGPAVHYPADNWGLTLS
ncbi:MAG: hypothetical protein ABI460_21345 [Caldimonas sp.]